MAVPPWLARCPGCGYDLTETDLNTRPCPECGWKATEEDRERLRRRWVFERRARRRAAWSVKLGVPVAVIATLVRAIVDGATLGEGVLAGAGAMGLVALVLGMGYVASMLVRDEDWRLTFLVWCGTWWWLLLGWFGALVAGDAVGVDMRIARTVSGAAMWLLEAKAARRLTSIRYGVVGWLAFAFSYLLTLFGGIAAMAMVAQ